MTSTYPRPRLAFFAVPPFLAAPAGPRRSSIELALLMPVLGRLGGPLPGASPLRASPGAMGESVLAGVPEPEEGCGVAVGFVEKLGVGWGGPWLTGVARILGGPGGAPSGPPKLDGPLTDRGPAGPFGGGGVAEAVGVGAPP
jgi:hypothetical protein